MWSYKFLSIDVFDYQRVRRNCCVISLWKSLSNGGGGLLTRYLLIRLGTHWDHQISALNRVIRIYRKHPWKCPKICFGIPTYAWVDSCRGSEQFSPFRTFWEYPMPWPIQTYHMKTCIKSLYIWILSHSMGVFINGATPSYHPFIDGDFPWNQASSELGLHPAISGNLHIYPYLPWPSPILVGISWQGDPPYTREADEARIDDLHCFELRARQTHQLVVVAKHQGTVELITHGLAFRVHFKDTSKPWLWPIERGSREKCEKLPTERRSCFGWMKNKLMCLLV